MSITTSAEAMTPRTTARLPPGNPRSAESGAVQPAQQRALVPCLGEGDRCEIADLAAPNHVDDPAAADSMADVDAVRNLARPDEAASSHAARTESAGAGVAARPPVPGWGTRSRRPDR